MTSLAPGPGLIAAPPAAIAALEDLDLTPRDCPTPRRTSSNRTRSVTPSP